MYVDDRQTIEFPGVKTGANTIVVQAGPGVFSSCVMEVVPADYIK